MSHEKPDLVPAEPGIRYELHKTILYTVLTTTGLTPVHTLYLNCEEGACRPLPRCIP